MSLDLPTQLANPATSLIVDEIHSLRDEVGALRKAISDSRQDTPAWIDLPLLTSIRLHVKTFILTVSAAADYTLVSGTRTLLHVTFNGADTKVIPLEITIEEGSNVSVVAGAGGAVVDAHFIYVPEQGREKQGNAALSGFY